MATIKPTMHPGVIWARSAAIGNVTPPPQLKIDTGYFFAEKPLHDNFNSKLQQTDTMLVHIQENGITTWDAVTDYQEGGYTKEGTITYMAINPDVAVIPYANKNKQPSLTPTYWERIYPTKKSIANDLINGDFQVWQRGVAFLGITTSEFTADRWTALCTNPIDSIIVKKSTHVYTDINIEAGHHDVAPYWLAINASGLTNQINLQQKVENPVQFANNTYTVSFQAKGVDIDSSHVTIAARIIAVRAGVNLTIGAYSMGTVVSRPAVTGTRRKLVFTIDVPWAHLDDMGDYDESYMELNIVMGKDTFFSTSSVFHLTEIKLERGAVATSFEGRSREEELSLCQRYYQEAAGQTEVRGYTDLTSNYIAQTISFATLMRTTPTMVLTTFSSTNVTNLGLAFPQPDGFVYSVEATAPGFCLVACRYTADAEL